MPLDFHFSAPPQMMSLRIKQWKKILCDLLTGKSLLELKSENWPDTQHVCVLCSLCVYKLCYMNGNTFVLNILGINSLCYVRGANHLFFFPKM